MTYPLPDGSNHFHRNKITWSQLQHTLQLLGLSGEDLHAVLTHAPHHNIQRAAMRAFASVPWNRNPFSTPHGGNSWGAKFQVRRFGRYLRKYKKFPPIGRSQRR